MGILDAPPFRGRTDATDDPFQLCSYNAGYLMTGYDPVANMTYYIGNGIYQSADYGANFSSVKAIPPGVTDQYSITKIVRFGDYLWCTAKDAADGLTKLYRATPQNLATNLTWSAALLTLTTGATSFGPALQADASYLYVGEYGDPSGLRPKAFKISLADANGAGTNWVTMWQASANTRHVHTVAPDPYNPGHIWLAGGDGQGFEILRSTDYGANWTVVTTLLSRQVVQISFSPKWVYTACDTARCTVLVWDRATLTPRAGSSSWHGNAAVPGGSGNRRVTDAVTNGTTTLTSATAAFTSTDKGRFLRSPSNLFTPGTFIASVTNATTVVLSRTVASGTALDVTFLGDSFYKSAYYGAVDPATGIYYALANDTSGGGTSYGLFALMDVGGPLTLLDSSIQGAGELFFAGGQMHFYRHRRPLINPVQAT